jgi:hypothetical protein
MDSPESRICVYIYWWKGGRGAVNILECCYLQTICNILNVLLKSNWMYTARTVPKWQSVPTPVPAPWNKHTKTIKKTLWLYTTVVLLTMDACDIRNTYSKNFSRKRILYIQLDVNKTRYQDVRNHKHYTLLIFCWPCTTVYQYRATKVMHLLFNL